jgi:hypothetical protein
MNTSMGTADRATHVKIVVVALIAAILVVIGGLNARLTDTQSETAAVRANGVVIKAGQPAHYSSREASAIR